MSSDLSLIQILDTQLNIEDEEMPDLLEQSPYYDTDEVSQVFGEKKDIVKILSLNCQSLCAKYDQLKIYV